MKALIINLASAGDRMTVQRDQMAALDIDGERIEAVTPLTLAPPAADPVWHRWERPLRATEMALVASHMAAWRRVIALGVPCLVLEDDAVLAEETPGFLATVAGRTDIDHISLETRSRKKVVARALDGRAPMRRLYQDRTGSAAYAVWPSGARKLLAHAQRAGGPSDAIISSAPTMRSFQADPALAIQLDRCVEYGVRLPLDTRSLVDAVPKPFDLSGYTALQRLGFRIRRAAAQLRMGWRHISHLATAERRHIEPARDWPALSSGQSPSV